MEFNGFYMNYPVCFFKADIIIIVFQ